MSPPDTVITLTTGQILRVRESADEVVRRIVDSAGGSVGRRASRRNYATQADLAETPKNRTGGRTGAETSWRNRRRKKSRPRKRRLPKSAKPPKGPGSTKLDFSTVAGIGLALSGIIGGLVLEKGKHPGCHPGAPPP